MKRLLSILLALTMFLCLAAPALASQAPAEALFTDYDQVNEAITVIP